MWEFLGWITKVCGWYVKVLHIFTGYCDTSIACLIMEFFGALHLWPNGQCLYAPIHLWCIAYLVQCIAMQSFGAQIIKDTQSNYKWVPENCEH